MRKIEHIGIAVKNLQESNLLFEKLFGNPPYKEEEVESEGVKTSFFMNQIITRGENAIAEAKIHLVFVNDKGKPVKVPDLIFDNFKPYFCDSIKF